MQGLLVTAYLAFAAEYGPSFEEGWIGWEAEDQADTGVGGCSDQYLRGGEQLPDLPLFYTRTNPNTAWGTAEMVDLLVETARHMRWLMPHASPLVIGDVSRERGGVLSGHKTHRGGIDADVGIYRKGAWQPDSGFGGVSPSQFDVEANWMLVSAMLDTGRVDMILLDRAHIGRLRDYVLRAGLLDEDEADRVLPRDGRGHWSETGVVRHAPGHADHIHVRVLCPDGSKGTR